MAGGAVAGQGWCAVVIMAADQPTADRCRLGDMAVTTARMAACTVIIKCLLHRRVVSVGATFFKHRPVPFQVVVQVVWLHCGDIGVATATGLFSILTGSADQVGVGDILVRALNAIMALDTTNLAVYRSRIGFGIYENFFPYLQRRYFAPSPLTSAFTPMCILRWTCRINQHLLICMAVDAFVDFRCDGSNRSILSVFCCLIG